MAPSSPTEGLVLKGVSRAPASRSPFLTITRGTPARTFRATAAPLSSGPGATWTAPPSPYVPLRGSVTEHSVLFICQCFALKIVYALAVLNMSLLPYPPSQALGLWKEESVYPQSGSLQPSCWTPLSPPGAIQGFSHGEDYGGRCRWAPRLQQTGLCPTNKRRCSDKHNNRLGHSPRPRCCPEPYQVSILLQHPLSHVSVDFYSSICLSALRFIQQQ